MLAGTDFRVTADGQVHRTTPKYEVFYRWADGALCKTLDELRQDVRDILEKARLHGIEEELMVEELNRGERRGETDVPV